MSSLPEGYNPLRWNCAERGCFNTLRRPKIEVFADCLPRRIAFSDVDGIVEINSHALMLEWKSDRRSVPTGQRIMYERLTRDAPLTVFCIIGDAETMVISAIGVFFHGRWKDWEAICLEELKNRIRRWVAWAEKSSKVAA